MGSFDVVELCELVGTYIQLNLKNIFPKIKSKLKEQSNIMTYKINKYGYNSQQFEVIKSFSGNTFFDSKITLDEDSRKQSINESVNAFYEGRELVLNTFESGIFPLKPTSGKEILTPNQMLLGLTIALAQVKAANIFENLLNEILQIFCCLYREK